MKQRRVSLCGSANALWQQQRQEATLFATLPLSSLAAGVDEAGRGCLAGPVVAAAVILSPETPIEGLADSKALRPAQREALAREIRSCALAWALGIVRAQRIDAINILQATFEAMSLAMGKLSCVPGKIFIDGNKTPPMTVFLPKWQQHHHQTTPPLLEAVVGGDASLDAIAAASILAKTYRDRFMEYCDHVWPAYGFGQHKGYGTKQHYAALQAWGPCPLHRRTFRGVVSEGAVEKNSGEQQAEKVTQGSLL